VKSLVKILKKLLSETAKKNLLYFSGAARAEDDVDYSKTY
jgi:hypothetical protein